jgi:hypothetical protein
MSIRNYVVTVFKCEVIKDIQCSLKTALCLVLINQILGIVFFYANLSLSALI